jgi:hypothetical protein
MRGSSPRWLLYLVTGFAMVVFAYCLWSGKVGFKGSRYVATRAHDPDIYWLRLFILAAMIISSLYMSIR